jgi:hypothetical protein
MKHVFEANDISFQCHDNSFTDISDVAKAKNWLIDLTQPNSVAALMPLLDPSTLFLTLSRKNRARLLLVCESVRVRN